MSGSVRSHTLHAVCRLSGSIRFRKLGGVRAAKKPDISGILARVGTRVLYAAGDGQRNAIFSCRQHSEFELPRLTMGRDQHPVCLLVL